MKIEIGKRYRFEPNDSCPATLGGDFTVVDDGGSLKMTNGAGAYITVYCDGTVPGLGRLVEIAEPAKAVPIFGDDADAFARLQERFKTWDFSTGTY